MIVTDFPNYDVCPKGIITERDGSRVIPAHRDKDGYLICDLRDTNRKYHTVRVHRIVAKAFCKNPKGLPMVNHKNELKDDNRACNLEWCDQLYNVNYGNARAKHLKSMIESGYCRRTEQLDAESLKTIATFNSTSEAGRATGISQRSIHTVATGKRVKDGRGYLYTPRTAGGFAWRFS